MKNCVILCFCFISLLEGEDLWELEIINNAPLKGRTDTTQYTQIFSKLRITVIQISGGSGETDWSSVDKEINPNGLSSIEELIYKLGTVDFLSINESTLGVESHRPRAFFLIAQKYNQSKATIDKYRSDNIIKRLIFELNRSPNEIKAKCLLNINEIIDPQIRDCVASYVNYWSLDSSDYDVHWRARICLEIQNKRLAEQGIPPLIVELKYIPSKEKIRAYLAKQPTPRPTPSPSPGIKEHFQKLIPTPSTPDPFEGKIYIGITDPFATLPSGELPSPETFDLNNPANWRDPTFYERVERITPFRDENFQGPINIREAFVIKFWLCVLAVLTTPFLWWLYRRLRFKKSSS